MQNNIFKKRLDQLGIGRQVDAAVVVARAQKVIHDHFGEHGDNNLQVISYRNGVLKMASSSSAWAAEVRNISQELTIAPVERVQYILGLPKEA